MALSTGQARPDLGGQRPRPGRASSGSSRSFSAADRDSPLEVGIGHNSIYYTRSMMVDDRSNQTNGVLALAQAWLPVLTVVGGALWALYTYLDHAKEAAKTLALSEKNLAIERNAQSERESRTRLIEAQKPFLDKQLNLYFETSQVVGRLVTEDLSSSNWTKDRARFEELYWSELTMVEHAEVASAMVEFRSVLRSNPINMDTLRTSALTLAHALRRGIEESWGNSAVTTNRIVAPYEK
jgi:hypothetical protein